MVSRTGWGSVVCDRKKMMLCTGSEEVCEANAKAQQLQLTYERPGLGG